VQFRGIKDLLAGLIFLAIGAAAIHFAREYPFGTAVRMGSGYFPTVLGWILGGFGAVLAARGVWSWVRSRPRKQEATLDFIAKAKPAPALAERMAVGLGWRPLACVTASMLAFGALMPRAGLVPALVVLFFLAALGGREFRWRGVAVLTAVMTAFAVAVFVYLLKLPFPLVPGMYLR
jgi:putative tricarboxylic transport membrane protein